MSDSRIAALEYSSVICKHFQWSVQFAKVPVHCSISFNRIKLFTVPDGQLRGELLLTFEENLSRETV